MTTEQGTRIERELAILRESGSAVELHQNPDVVIYRGLRSALANTTTDVLVHVPAGYPGSMLDRACLPTGSPLLGRVKGAVQEMITAAGQQWQAVSYHPHNGGGGPPWNPNLHGFHTYIDEVLTWLADGR